MPSIGPTQPPQPAKRSRDDDDDAKRSSSPDSSDKRRRVIGPAAPPRSNSPARTSGPSLPPDARSRSSSSASDVGLAPPQPSKPARILGPAPSPAPLDERPPNPPEDDTSDSSDDDFGPAPPPAGVIYGDDDDGAHRPAKSAFDTDAQFTEAPKKAQRDDWMTMPPTQDDLAARMDPTKMRARKFNTGKGAGATGGMSSAWTETPEQKLKRLQNEALGIAPPSNASPSTATESRKTKEEERRARKMREKIDAARGKSLVEQHQDKGAGKEKEDDPSKRAFDYEKDMAVSGTVNHKQRREMLSKSKGFSDRFSGGSFL
ncbi:hypothetical protein N0V83_004305 [Neocucurbitaria cava]|uniref:DUF3752 domain-containing protein n=1 Tax=Neocucurbitaria cava TaxID=798079 RepID=A0A9W8YB42_9PLEO|nr:hypothetical protein N0V83_004305 [Neocucurbitaria cava]